MRATSLLVSPSWNKAFALLYKYNIIVITPFWNTRGKRCCPLRNKTSPATILVIITPRYSLNPLLSIIFKKNSVLISLAPFAHVSIRTRSFNTALQEDHISRRSFKFKSFQLLSMICESGRQAEIKTFYCSLITNIKILASQSGCKWTLPLQMVTQWVQNLKKKKIIFCTILKHKQHHENTVQ